MIIGIDASRAFIKNKTGIEEYSYQVIKYLRNKLDGHQVVLYLRGNQEVDFQLPENWKVKKLSFPRLWTQVRLSLELLFHSVDALFVPAHTVPIIHPQNTFVTIHGLEYEFCGNAYSAWEKIYMRFSIKNSCRWASRIICVSKNTREDLMNLYGVPENKTVIIHEGYGEEVMLIQAANAEEILHPESEARDELPYIFFIGRLEERKNIVNIIWAFNLLKKKYNIPHRLVLAGKPGYGYERIEKELQNSSYRDKIIFLGYVSEGEKWKLLKGAAVFIFPTCYEGFGIPILEAQSVGTPVVTSNVSSLPEISGGSTLLVDPHNYQEIAEATYALVNNEKAREDIVRRGYDNIKRFGWDKCAEEISRIIAG